MIKIELINEWTIFAKQIMNCLICLRNISSIIISQILFSVLHNVIRSSVEGKLSRVDQKEMKCTAPYTEIRGGLL